MKNLFKSCILLCIILFLLTNCQHRKEKDFKKVSRKSVLENESRNSKKIDALQTNTFEWESELCEHKGYFEPKLHSLKQIEDLHYLLYRFNNHDALGNNETLNNPEDFNVSFIEKSLRKLDSEYIESVKKLKSLQIPHTKLWQEKREYILHGLEELYNLKKLTLKAHLNPTLLIKTSYSDLCAKYINTLTSKDTTSILKAWEELVEAQKSKNGYPENIEVKYQSQLNSNQRLSFARIELMTFGWWNCANNQRKYSDNFPGDNRLYKEFDSLFTKIETACEE